MSDTLDPQSLTEKIKAASAWIPALQEEIGKVVIGQRYLVDRLIVGLLANGHVLLEGVPGLAKTLSVRTLAAAIRGDFARLQFTPDLLPADIIGTLIYNPKSGEFTTKTGPVFANIVLADEINRAPAKVQSALLEAMQERQVTIGETTFALPRPFLVLATENPIDQEGTYPLPEAQVDRFMMKLKIGYPSREEERGILDRMAVTTAAPEAQPVVDLTQIMEARAPERRVCRPQGERLYRGDRAYHAASGRTRPRRAARFHSVWRESAGDHFPDTDRQGMGLHARARLCHPPGRENDGHGCSAPPNHPHLRSGGRGKEQRRRPQTNFRYPARAVNPPPGGGPTG